MWNLAFETMLITYMMMSLLGQEEMRNEILWLKKPFEHTIFMNLDTYTIETCETSSGCQYLPSSQSDSSFQELTPIAIQQGITIKLIASNLSSIHVYKTTTENYFSCQNDSYDNQELLYNASSSSYNLTPDVLSVGQNVFICDSLDEDITCQSGCRLNITVKDNRCGHTKDLCSGNGRCSSLPLEEHFYCKCNDNFSGEACQQRREANLTTMACTDDICMNGGSCVAVADDNNTVSRYCKCPAFLSGSHCEVILNNCMSSPCQKGICVEKEWGYQCYCVPGFHGKHCELEYNECLSNPCNNRGTCVDKVDKYECRCRHGFSGINCENKIHLCKSSPCHSNSTCIELENVSKDAFQCVCPDGQTGLLCDQKVETCSSNPCKNHGTCKETENGYHCSCQIMFAGLHCEYMLDIFAPPMEGSESDETHKHNMYIVAGTLGSMVLIVVSVIVACYCKIYETYKQLMWKKLRYHRRRSNSCPDLESCSEPTYIGKHRLSADAVLEATSLFHDNASFENYNSSQALSSLQI